MNCTASISSNRLPCRRLIEVRVERGGKLHRVILNLRLRRWNDQSTGIGNNRRTTCIKQILNTRQIRIERKRATALRCLQDDGKKVSLAISKSRSSRACRRERAEGL